MFIALGILICRINIVNIVPVSQVGLHFGAVYDKELETTAVGWPPVA
jgi:hypothetical protein